jgi:predicted alpha/beta-fold hydrolase
MAPGQSLFIVGNSLGANIIAKYLGEEGLSNTLPKCVAGGITLGNPLQIQSKSLGFPWGQLLGVGVKKTMILNRKALSSMKKGSSAFKQAYRDILMASTVGEIDCIYAPFKIRNEPIYPYNPKIGYTSGEDYWKDAGSYQYIPHVNVPLLQISAMDDFLVHHNAMAKLNDSLSNPNIIVAKTKSGGHLGWNDATGLSSLLFGASWADRATTEFIQAVLDLKGTIPKSKPPHRKSLHLEPVNEAPGASGQFPRSKL